MKEKTTVVFLKYSESEDLKVCPRCGIENNNSEEKCVLCGTALNLVQHTPPKVEELYKKEVVKMNYIDNSTETSGINDSTPKRKRFFGKIEPWKLVAAGIAILIIILEKLGLY